MNVNNKDNNISFPIKPQPFENNSKEASDVSGADEKNNPQSNNRVEQNNFQPNSYKIDEKEYKTQQFAQESEDGEYYDEYDDEYFEEDEGEGGDGYFDENNDEDDDERFIKQDPISSELEEASNKITQDIMADLDEYNKGLEGIRPNTNNIRSLSNEHGGLEVKEHDGVSHEDVWDKRSEDLDQVADDEYDRLTDASTSSLRKSFLHRKKQQKRRGGKKQSDIDEEMEAAESHRMNIFEANKERKSSFADKVNDQRSSNSRGGGGGIRLF